ETLDVPHLENTALGPGQIHQRRRVRGVVRHRFLEQDVSPLTQAIARDPEVRAGRSHDAERVRRFDGSNEVWKGGHMMTLCHCAGRLRGDVEYAREDDIPLSRDFRIDAGM